MMHHNQVVIKGLGTDGLTDWYGSLLKSNFQSLVLQDKFKPQSHLYGSAQQYKFCLLFKMWKC